MSEPSPPLPTSAPAAPEAAPQSPPAAAQPASAPMGQLTLPQTAVDGMLSRLASQALAQPQSPPVMQPPAAQPATPQAEPPKPAAPDTDTLAALRSALVRAEVMRVAEREGAVDPDTVLALVRERYDITNDGRVIVRDDPRAQVVDDLKRFLASKPFLLRPLAPAGGSPAPAAVQPPAPPPGPDFTTNSGLTAFARNLAVKRGLRRVG